MASLCWPQSCLSESSVELDVVVAEVWTWDLHNIVIYRKYIFGHLDDQNTLLHVFGLIHNSWFLAPKLLEFPTMKTKKVSCYVNKMTFGLHLGTEVGCQGIDHVIRGLKLSVPPPDLLRGKRGWRLNLLPTANDLINYAYIMNPQ